MENLLIFNAFDCFELPYRFQIENLDAKYFHLFKQPQKNKAQLNNAYAVLKHPEKRLLHLLEIHQINQTDHNIAKIVMTQRATLNLNEIKDKMFEAAKINDLHEAWKWMQYLRYLSRF